MNIIAGLLGFATFIAGAFLGIVAIGLSGAGNAPAGATAAVLWCGGLLIMVVSGLRADLQKAAKPV